MDYRSDYDSAWKNALDAYFPQFMALFWPALHARIDWRQAPEFLDKELQAVARGTPRGRRHVDKLVRVRLLDGQDALVLIHVEIQGRPEQAFPRRMFIYHVRLREKHPQHPLVSLAVYTGRKHGVNPGRDNMGRSPVTASYEYEYWGCELSFSFPVIHLEVWRNRIVELLEMAPHNPFAVVILAQLEANAVRDGPMRLVRKTTLVRNLYHWGFNRDNVIELFRIIDAMLALPEALEPIFDDAVAQIEEETKMTYVTSVERVRLKREREAGREEGRLNATAHALFSLIQRKFGDVPGWARVRIDEANETDLSRWTLQILDAQRVEDVFA